MLNEEVLLNRSTRRQRRGFADPPGKSAFTTDELDGHGLGTDCGPVGRQPAQRASYMLFRFCRAATAKNTDRHRLPVNMILLRLITGTSPVSRPKTHRATAGTPAIAQTVWGQETSPSRVSEKPDQSNYLTIGQTVA